MYGFKGATSVSLYAASVLSTWESNCRKRSVDVIVYIRRLKQYLHTHSTLLSLAPLEHVCADYQSAFSTVVDDVALSQRFARGSFARSYSKGKSKEHSRLKVPACGCSSDLSARTTP